MPHISRFFRSLAWIVPALAFAAPVPIDLSAVKSGPIAVTHEGDMAFVRWQDSTSRTWEASLNLEPARPLIAAIKVGGKTVVQNAVPIYNAQTGKRRGGFDEFFDFPPSHPDGTRSYQGNRRITGARAETLGDRVEITFDGFQMGIFTGSIRYVFYPGSRLIQQAAVASTNEPDTAYFYDAGLRMAVPRDSRPGDNMESEITYYDTEQDSCRASERFGTAPCAGSLSDAGRASPRRKHRGVPHAAQILHAARFHHEYGLLWHTAWRGQVYLGIRQLPDDNSRFYPWMNAPARHRSADECLLSLERRRSQTAARRGPALYERGQVSEAGWLCHGCSALALRLYRTGYGEGQGRRLGSAV